MFDSFLSQLRGDPDTFKCPACKEPFESRTKICRRCGHDANWEKWTTVLASWGQLSSAGFARRFRRLSPMDRAYMSSLRINEGTVGSVDAGPTAVPEAAEAEPPPRPNTTSGTAGLVSLFGGQRVETPAVDRKAPPVSEESRHRGDSTSSVGSRGTREQKKWWLSSKQQEGEAADDFDALEKRLEDEDKGEATSDEGW